MSRRYTRLVLGAAVLLAGLGGAAAQDPPKRDRFDDYRQFFKKPETVLEYWTAIEFERELGAYELVAKHLKGLLEIKKPTDAELVELEKQVGLANLIRLRNAMLEWAPRWKRQADDLTKEIREAADNRKKDLQAKQADLLALSGAADDAETLLKRTTEAVKTHLGDPKRITKFIQQLYASPEEQAYALNELYQGGSVVAPYLVEELRVNGADNEKR